MTVPSRRWLRFSLRFLMLLIAVVAIPLAWKVNRVRNQRAVIAEIRKLPGFMFYDYERNYGVGISTSSGPPGPEWLRDLLGIDYFADVVHVNISGPQVTDETLHRLASLPHLQLLGAESDNITDQGVAVLARSKDLFSVGVTSKQLTVASVDHLQGLPKLYWLACSGQQVDDSWVPHIVELKTVQCIQLTDARVSDRGIAELVRMPLLHGIYFSDMPISDATLDQLHGMTKLTRLGLHQTQATKEGVKRFQTALPSCVVRQF
jgi:hypothetical protein